MAFLSSITATLTSGFWQWHPTNPEGTKPVAPRALQAEVLPQKSKRECLETSLDCSAKAAGKAAEQLGEDAAPSPTPCSAPGWPQSFLVWGVTPQKCQTSSVQLWSVNFCCDPRKRLNQPKPLVFEKHHQPRDWADQQESEHKGRGEQHCPVMAQSSGCTHRRLSSNYLPRTACICLEAQLSWPHFCKLIKMTALTASCCSSCQAGFITQPTLLPFIPTCML